MPMRFERWIRSKLSTSTARTPSSLVPLAAQSREDPMPYSLPAEDDQWDALGLRRPSAASKIDVWSPSGSFEGDPALGARGQLVAQADVGERAAHHDLVVAAPRAVGVEVRLVRRRASTRYCPAGVVARMLPAGRCGRW